LLLSGEIIGGRGTLLCCVLALSLPASRIVLDGEAVAHCLEGLPDFHRLLSNDGQATACLYAFDLLWLEAQDLRGVELIGRRRLLAKALKKAGPALRFSEHMEGAAGAAMFRRACAMGLEGIVSKRVTSRYKSGACRSWLKVKNPNSEPRAGRVAQQIERQPSLGPLRRRGSSLGRSSTGSA